MLLLQSKMSYARFHIVLMYLCASVGTQCSDQMISKIYDWIVHNLYLQP